MLDSRLLFVSIIWGVNFSVVKFALNDFLPMSFTVLRFAVAALFLMTLMAIQRVPFGIDRRDLGPFIGLGLIGITLYNILFMYGLTYTTASNSALFIAASPLFAALIQAASGNERLSVRTGAGLALSFFGVALILQGKAAGIVFTRTGVLGDLLTLCAAAFWALYTLNSRPLLERYSAMKVTAYSMAAGTVLLLPIGIFELSAQRWSGISAASWSGFAFSAFLSGGIAFSLWYQGVKRLGATRTIAYHYLVPLVAVLVAAFFLHERMTLPQFMGGALILAGVYLTQKKGPEGMKVRG